MELKERVPEGCDAMTMHSMGLKAVTRAFGRVRVNSYRVQDIISELLETDIRELRRRKPEVLKATERLVGLCKMNLVGTDTGDNRGDWYDSRGMSEALADLAVCYDVDLNGNSHEVFALVPRVLERCKVVDCDGCIDFNDMIWLPIALDLSVYRYDLLLVDELQDLNRCQQALARKAGRRLILCGDPKQAIYGFAGADAESMSRMEVELGATDQGCVHLPLTVTYRCGKRIVAEAQRYVADFDAHESNGEGRVSCASFKDRANDLEEAASYRTLARNGDMILSRVNAPLVSECFKFLRQGVRANIQGRDVGQGLISTIRKLMKGYTPKRSSESPDAPEVLWLLERLDDWLHAEQRKENTKRNPSDARLIALQDRADCISAFTADCKTADEIVQKIESIFTDDRNGRGIKLSSIHKAKGLEAARVFFIRNEEAPCPHPMAKTTASREQESHLLYIAITRAIEELIYVS